jgi:hypothetical protein
MHEASKDTKRAISNCKLRHFTDFACARSSHLHPGSLPMLQQLLLRCCYVLLFASHGVVAFLYTAPHLASSSSLKQRSSSSSSSSSSSGRSSTSSSKLYAASTQTKAAVVERPPAPVRALGGGKQMRLLAMDDIPVVLELAFEEFMPLGEQPQVR